MLVLVAAGLVSSAIHTAHEAAWLNAFQAQAVNLELAGAPGSILGSLVTGVLGIQPSPTVGERTGWLLYAIPMLLYVLWPRRLRLSPRLSPQPHPLGQRGAAR